jgi:hypothetical protein
LNYSSILVADFYPERYLPSSSPTQRRNDSAQVEKSIIFHHFGSRQWVYGGNSPQSGCYAPDINGNLADAYRLQGINQEKRCVARMGHLRKRTAGPNDQIPL